MRTTIKPLVRERVLYTKRMMMTEEQKLRDIAPAGNPFRVPEGYFENLAMRTMDNIGKYEARRHRRTWLRRSIAAAVAGIVATAGFMVIDNNAYDMPVADNEGIVSNEELEYAMIANSDIEYYLTEADE